MLASLAFLEARMYRMGCGVVATMMLLPSCRCSCFTRAASLFSSLPAPSIFCQAWEVENMERFRARQFLWKLLKTFPSDWLLCKVRCANFLFQSACKQASCSSK